ncbi:MAG TPA: ATP-binding protein [Candidatus Paceibacterota bacterium]|nr:ATP-binding protein [Verrucomicrobiota bacterium]HRY49430.1 ATP-binding protein [Candidatus Paceibacterota bacterium]
MNMKFVNREAELRELDAAAKHGGLLVVFGRRRVGKTRLMRQWLQAHNGLYSQAIEAQRDLQIQQVFADLRPQLETQLVPKTWPEMLEILSLQKRRWALCLDEFPYLTAVDSSLPSQLQKWLDHALPPGCLLLVAGSSTNMMHDLFLHRAAPLYGRARKLLQVLPMDYAAFCDACGLRRSDADSFEKFACVGGIPKYWEFVEAGQDAVALAESLYFDYAPYMEQEPQRLLRDEGVIGLNALAVLEAVGRGAERPSEIASRLGTAQTNLSRLLLQLIDASILTRELPFGGSVRTTKKILYRIQDPTMRFWFRVFSPHQSRWRIYAAAEKRKLIHDHAATVFEDVCRARFPGAQRYWEGNVELDLVAPDPDDPKRLLVAEVKWRRLTAAERQNVLRQLESKWAHCSLRTRHPNVHFDVLDATILGV